MFDENLNQISWQAPEFRHYQKNVVWYTVVIAITILVAGFFLIQKDIFAAATMVIMAGLIVFFSRQHPQEVTITLSAKGVQQGNVFYPYKQIKHFWVVNDHNHKTVNFHTTALLNNSLIIELEDRDPESVKQFLLHYLPEHDDDQGTLIQQIIHKIKF